jgi:hypothetical protein
MDSRYKIVVTIEKSFEGEFRGVVRKDDGDFDLITMPWIVGADNAFQKLGTLFSKKTADVMHCLDTDTPLSREFLTNFR